MQTWFYAIGAVVDAANAAQEGQLLTVVQRINNLLAPFDSDSDGVTNYFILNGVTIDVPGKQGAPDTARIAIVPYVGIGTGTRAATRRAINEHSIEIQDMQVIEFSDKSAVAEMNAYLLATAKNAGIRAMWLVNRTTVVPTTGILALPNFVVL